MAQRAQLHPANQRAALGSVNQRAALGSVMIERIEALVCWVHDKMRRNQPRAAAEFTEEAMRTARKQR